MRRPLHKVGHPTCAHKNWGECDRAADSRYMEWQAMQQVVLAYNLVVGGVRWKDFRKEKSVFAQLVLHIAGEREDIMNDDGNPSRTPFVAHIRSAIERVKAGDLSAYNLYRLGTSVEPLAQGGAMPYIDGKRVSNDEWNEKNGSTVQLHTSERGENPGEEGIVLADINVPDSGADKDNDDKVVVGTRVLDVSDVTKADPADVSVVIGDRTDGSDKDAEDKVPATAPEAAADFVEKSKAKRAKRA